MLEAAEALGIEIPTLCYLKGWEPSTSCLVCMVKVRGSSRLVPSCATKVAEGMEIESETAEVHQVRKTALELLLSDHLGDCLAPCHFACPAHMNIPLMLRQIGADALRDAIVTIKEEIALPAVLGRVCPKPCEKGCRRHAADGAVAVCELKRYAADADLASPDPYTPSTAPPTGKRVAIVGAGPTGLSAAYYLRRDGHEVLLLDEHPQPGGRLRYQVREDELPRAVLDAEIAQVLRLGVNWRPSTTIATRAMLDELLGRFNAVLLAWGECAGRGTNLRSNRRTAERRNGGRRRGDAGQTSSPGLWPAACRPRDPDPQRDLYDPAAGTVRRRRRDPRQGSGGPQRRRRQGGRQGDQPLPVSPGGHAGCRRHGRGQQDFVGAR